jgi:acyl-coenzyme A synthetase/AMP-(fatty) acid ligase/thioesterase domain-containing protein
MLQENTKQNFLTDIAKWLVENTAFRNYIKNLSLDENTSFDSQILLEVKTLAQRIDLPEGLTRTKGTTLLEKAISYLESSVILAEVSEDKLEEFIGVAMSLSLKPENYSSKEQFKAEKGDLVRLNVSGHGNNCGLFALALGVKIALEQEPSKAAAYESLTFLKNINFETLQHATHETNEVGKMLRVGLAAALAQDETYKAERIESFIECCFNYLIEADFAKLDRDMKGFYEPNRNQLVVIYTIWSTLVQGARNSSSNDDDNEPKTLDENAAREYLNAIESYNVTQSIESCYQKILLLLQQTNQSNFLGKINELFSSLSLSDADPIIRLIKLRKIYCAAWDRVQLNQADEIRRQMFNEAMSNFFTRQCLQQFVGNIVDPANIAKLLKLALIETVTFDRNGALQKRPAFSDILSSCRSLFARLQVTTHWDELYQKYCNNLEIGSEMITVDELGCLAKYWKIQLLIECPDHSVFSTYSKQDPQLLQVRLANLSGIHWEVEVEKTILLNISQQFPASSSSSTSSSITSSNASLRVLGPRGVFDSTLSEPLPNDKFEAEINRLANYLLAKYPKAKCVALFMPQSVNYMRCFFALHNAGMAPMPISPDTDAPAARLAGFLESGQINLIISIAKYRSHPFFNTNEAKAKPIFYVDENADELLSYPATKPAGIINHNEDLAYIVNTSGSTGKPKQVLVPHRGLKDCTDGHVDTLKITAADNIAAYADTAFDAHIIEMLIQRRTGASLFIVPADIRRDIVKLSKFYQTHRITVGVFVASMLRQCKRKDFPDLRVVISTGEKIEDSIINEWSGVTLVDGYGPAEYTIATWLRIIREGDKSNMHLIPNTRYFIMEKEPQAPGVDVKPVKMRDEGKEGEEGELYLTGNGLALGYSDPKLTDERFINIPDPSDNTKMIRVYKTRDIVKQKSDGSIEILGRLDKQIKVYGRLVCPEEIEDAIKSKGDASISSTQSAITAVCVDASTTEHGHPEITAYIEYKGAQPLDLMPLYQNICAQLGQTFTPTQWVILSDLPRSQSGKVTIAGLAKPKELGIKRVQGSSLILPQSDLEKELAELFLDVLDIPKTDCILYRDDNFFHLGGKSLQATLLLQVLRSKYKLHLSYDEFAFTPTIEQLARAILRVRTNAQLIEPLYIEQQELTNAPVILIHSLLGDATQDYAKLKKEWKGSRSLYMISARGLKNPDDADNDLYAIARDYYVAIKEKFPRGLKIIAGWSMGGILATLVNYFFQREEDYSVAVLMIDSESPTLFHSMSLLDYAKYIRNLFDQKLALQIPLNELPSIETLALMPKDKQVYALFGKANELIREPGLADKKGSLATIRGLLLGVLKFQLDRRVSNVHMIAATETQALRNDESLGWPRDKVEVNVLQKISGNHDSIMLDSSTVRTLAASLEDFSKKQQDKFLVSSLADDKTWGEFPEIDREGLKYYIPAMGAASASTMDTTFPLLENVDKYLKSSKKVLLMLGAAGVGKTTFLQWLAIQLDKRRSKTDPIVLYIPLGSYENPDQDILVKHLRRLGYSDSQIAYLKKHQRFVVVFDGFDERQKNRYQNLYATNRLEEWDVQVIIGCRDSYLYNAQNYRQIFYPVKKGKERTVEFSEVIIVPFNDSQIEHYVKKFLNSPPDGFELDDEWKESGKYLEQIDTLPGLRHLIRNPFLLSVLMGILPDIVREYEELPFEKRLPLTQTKILDVFVENFWDSAALKLMLAGKRLGRDIRIDYEQFSIQLAEEMELAGLTQVIYRPPLNENEEPSQWERYFGDDEKKIRIREGCLLKRLTTHKDKGGKSSATAEALKGEVIGFLHPLLIKYFVCRGIYLQFLLMKQPEEDARLLAQHQERAPRDEYLAGVRRQPTFFQPATSGTATPLSPTSAQNTSAGSASADDDGDVELAAALALSLNLPGRDPAGTTSSSTTSVSEHDIDPDEAAAIALSMQPSSSSSSSK